MPPRRLQNVNAYLSPEGGPIGLSQLGIVMLNGSATLNNGERISGAFVAAVLRTGLAVKALTTPNRSRMILEGASLGGAVASVVFLPPAMIGIATIACYFGESYDLVIAVDGFRLRDTVDLVQLVGEAQPTIPFTSSSSAKDAVYSWQSGLVSRLPRSAIISLQAGEVGRAE